MRGNVFRHWLTAALIWATAWNAVAPASVHAGGLAAIDAYQVGRHHLANGQRAQALESFNDALRMNPQFVQAYVARGKLLAEMGQYSSALADLNFALHLQPTHVEGFAYRGFALLATGKPEQALVDLDTALRLDPTYARVHYLRSQTLREMGDDAEAQVSLATALQLDPTIEARQVVAVKHEGEDAGQIQLAVPPAVPERTSVLSTSEVNLPTVDRKKQGNVLRYDRHPILAKLEAPAVSQPRRPAYSEIEMPASRLPNRAGMSTPMPLKTPPMSTPDHPELSNAAPAEESKDAVSTTAEPILPDLPATDDATKPSDPSLAEAKPGITPLPSTELPKVEPVPIATETLPAETLPVEAVPAPVPMPVVAADTAPIVAAEPPMNASAILADPALAERLSSARPAATESDRLSAALAAARQAALERPEVVMSTDATSNVAVDMSVVSDAAPMAAVSDGGASASNTTAVATVAPAINDNAVAMVSDLPASGGATLLPPSVPQTKEAPQPKVETVPTFVSDAEFDPETKAALDRLDDAIRNNPADVPSRAFRADLLLSNNRFSAAVADFDEVLKLDPGQSKACFGRAQANYRLGRFADAIDDYSTVIKTDDQHAAALMERGHCSALLGKHADAERDRAAALALDPSLAKTGPKYGGAFADNAAPNATGVQASAFGNLFAEKNAAAPARSENAIFVSDAARPPVPEVVQAVAGNETTPESEIREASAGIAKTPGNAMLYVRRAQASLVLDRHDDALDDLTAALRIDPKCNAALTLRSRVEFIRSIGGSTAAPSVPRP